MAKLHLTGAVGLAALLGLAACNKPAEQAKARGLAPMPLNITPDRLDELPRPMLGYCRSGMRSTKTYEQTQHIRG